MKYVGFAWFKIDVWDNSCLSKIYHIVLQIELAVEKATRTLTDRKIEENKVSGSFQC